MTERANTRRWASAVCMLLATTLCPSVGRGQPAAPTGVVAVPTYSAARPITVYWAPSPGATGYAIERSTDGVNWVPAGNAGAGDTDWTDNTAKDLNETYHYQVRAEGAGGGSGWSDPTQTLICVTWPMGDGTHDILTGFADAAPNNNWDFHEGLDIAHPSGTVVDIRAIRGGVVDSLYGDKMLASIGETVCVRVDLGTTVEFDWYLHVTNMTVAKNQRIPEGAVVAGGLRSYQSEGVADTQCDHLHLMVSTSTVGSPQTDCLNPLERFTKDPDRDPLGQVPGVVDTNGDGETLYVVESGGSVPPGNFKPLQRQAVKGDVDILADVRDKMNADAARGPDGFMAAAAPYEVGYHIKALFNVGVPYHDVRAPGDPYVLAKFDDNWFAGDPFGTGKFSEVFADNHVPGHLEQDLRVQPNDTVFPFTKHFVLTNASGGVGLPADVDGGQYWNTNALDSGTVPDTHDTANFAGRADATRNADARFKDGDYQINVVSSDLVHGMQGEAVARVRLDNFKQTAATALGGQAPPTDATAPIYELTSQLPPWKPPFLLPPEKAGISEVYLVGDQIGVRGDQYYADLIMPAYVVGHKSGGWSQWSSLTFGAEASSKVLSDATGAVPLTAIWIADEPGWYDVIIDYDRNGAFSSTLDGLDGFVVLDPVLPRSPFAVARIDNHFDAGTLIATLNGSQSIDPEVGSTAISTYAWQAIGGVGYGRPLGTGPNPTRNISLAYAGLSSTIDVVEVLLTVFDEEGATGTDTVALRYLNAAPTVGGLAGTRNGNAVDFTGTVEDPDLAVNLLVADFETVIWEIDVLPAREAAEVGDGFLAGTGTAILGSVALADLIAAIGEAPLPAGGDDDILGGVAAPPDDCMRTVYFSAYDLAGECAIVPLTIGPIPEPTALALLVLSAGVALATPRRRPHPRRRRAGRDTTPCRISSSAPTPPSRTLP